MTIDRPAEFDARVIAHKRAIYRAAKRLNVPAQDADDFVNETICACLARWKSYSHGNSFFGWIVWQARAVRSSFMAAAAAQKRAGEITENALETLSTAPTQEADTHTKQMLATLAGDPYGEIVAMRAAGYEFSEIGKHFGFSKQRAHELYNGAVKRLGAARG